MNMEQRTFALKDGRTLTLRGAAIEDAQELINFLKTIFGETPFLLRGPDEVKLTLEQEEAFLTKKIDNPRSLMIIAEVDGELAGNCEFDIVSTSSRLMHRCSLGIALKSKYWGFGIGTIMFEALLDEAKKCGFEQAELEVFGKNERAIGLYTKLGFTVCGRVPDAAKYADGTYDELVHMVKKL